MRAAIQLPPDGQFDPAGYARLLRHLFSSRWTGFIGLELGGPTKKMHFADGYIVFAPRAIRRNASVTSCWPRGSSPASTMTTRGS